MCVEGSEFRSKTGACVSCVAKGSYELLSSDEPWIDEALNIEDSLSGKAQCQKCGRTVEEVNGKTYCSTVCLVGKGYVPISGIKNKDSITQYTENDYINGCVSCDNPNDYAINEKSAEAVAGCAACGHSTYSTSGIFPATTICGPMSCKSGEFKYFAYKDGSGNIAAQCISCKDTAPRYIHTISKFKTICEAEGCNRKAVGKWCVPTSCGTNEFLSASYFYHVSNYIESGGCQSCTDTGSYRLGDYTKTTNKTTGEVTYSIGEELQHFINQCESCNDTNKDGTISAEEKDTVRKVEMNKDGIAFCVPSTSACDGILGKDGTCYPCKTKKVEIASDSQSGCTANCKDETGQTTKWVVTGDAYLYCMDKCDANQFQGASGICYDCDLEQTINGIPDGDLKTLCTSCPNRIMTYDYCSYKQPCIAGTSFRSAINGVCISCDTETIEHSTDSTNCNACLPTANNKGRVLIGQNCVPKIQNETGLCSSIDGDYTGVDGTMFRGVDGKCYDCATTQQVKTGGFPKQCKVCGEQRQLDGEYCLINNGCNGGSTFWSVNDQTCIACNTSAIKVETSWDEQNHCDQCSSKRLMILETEDVSTAYCVQKCTANKWQDIDGNCYACDTNNGKGNIIGMDSASKKLCTDCNRTVAVDDAGNTVCQ